MRYDCHDVYDVGKEMERRSMTSALKSVGEITTDPCGDPVVRLCGSLEGDLHLPVREEIFYPGDQSAFNSQ